GEFVRVFQPDLLVLCVGLEEWLHRGAPLLQFDPGVLAHTKVSDVNLHAGTTISGCVAGDWDRPVAGNLPTAAASPISHRGLSLAPPPIPLRSSCLAW